MTNSGTQRTHGRTVAASVWWNGARGALVAAVVVALVLLAGLVVVLRPGSPQLQPVAAEGGCGGWIEDLPGRDESQMTVGFGLRNPSDHPVAVRGARATTDRGLRSVELSLRPMPSGGEETAFGWSGTPVGDADTAVVVPAHGEVWAAAEMHLRPGARAGHLTSVRAVTDGPLGTLETQVLPVGVGMSGVGEETC